MKKTGFTVLVVLLLSVACERNDPAGNRIDRLADHTDRMAVTESGPVRPAGDAAFRWTGDEIGSWHRQEEGAHVTLISPELPFDRLGAIDSIVIEVADLAGRSRLTLHWNDRPVLSEREKIQQRRELTAFGEGPKHTFILRGDDIVDIDFVGTGEGEKPPRHLFLRFPRAPEGDVRFETISVLGKAATVGVNPHGWMRMTVSGVVRDTFYIRTPGVFRFETDLSRGGTLRFGLARHNDGEALKIRISADGASTPRPAPEFADGVAKPLLAAELATSETWQEFEAVIPPGSGGRLIFEVESDTPGEVACWTNPMVIPADGGTRPPNIVLYVIDALRARQLGLYGYKKNTTPNLDALGAGGVVFLQAYAPVSWTKPSIATLMTSLYPQVHGVGERSYGDLLPESVITLPELLRDHGYVTANFASNPLSCTLSNLDQGFDDAYTSNAFDISDPVAKANKIHADDINRKVLPWIDRHAEHPFFLYIHSVDPHRPCSAPTTYPDLTGDSPVDHYDREIRFNDNEIGRLRAKLDALGLLENTLLIVTADHGESFDEHGFRGHGNHVYQEEMRIPLIFFHSGRLVPRKVEAPVQLIDLLPTVLRYAGVPFDDGRFEGFDIFDSERLQARKALFLSRFVYPEDMEVAKFNTMECYAVLSDRWKLIVTEDRNHPDARLALYDLRNDPGERHDLSAGEPDRVKRLNQALGVFLEDQARKRAAFVAEHHGREGAGSARSDAALSEDIIEQLRGLGYLK